MNLQVFIMAVVSKTDISRKIPKYFKFVEVDCFATTHQKAFILEPKKIALQYLSLVNNERCCNFTCLQVAAPPSTAKSGRF